MRLAVAILALSAAFSSANATLFARQNLPSCATSCIANANLGSCSETDATCLCNNQTFVSTTTSCIESSCTGNDLVAAEQYAQALCLAVGVTLSVPTPASTATTPSSASTTTGTPTAATSTPSQTSGASLSYGINLFAGAAAAVAFGAAL